MSKFDGDKFLEVAKRNSLPRFVGWLIVIGVVLILVANLSTSEPGASSTITKSSLEQYMKENNLYSVDFLSFADSYKDMTEVQQREFLKGLDKPLVEWTGVVKDVTSKEIFLAGSSSSFRKFDAEVAATEISKLPDIKKGQKVTIRGTLIRPGILTDWVVRDAVIIK